MGKALGKKLMGARGSIIKISPITVNCASLKIEREFKNILHSSF